jgi:hypothetical protein
MTTCEVVVEDAGDGNLLFDITFTVDGMSGVYHFTWVGDPSKLN